MDNEKCIPTKINSKVNIDYIIVIIILAGPSSCFFFFVFYRWYYNIIYAWPTVHVSLRLCSDLHGDSDFGFIFARRRPTNYRCPRILIKNDKFWVFFFFLNLSNGNSSRDAVQHCGVFFRLFSNCPYLYKSRRYSATGSEMRIFL